MSRYPQYPSADVRAKPYLEGFAQMGGESSESPWVPYPVFPTAPLVRKRGNVGYVSRYYFADPILNEQANAQVSRIIRFNYPVRIVAFYGAGLLITTDDSGNVTFAYPGSTGNLTNTFKVQFQDDQDDLVNTEAAVGTVIVGNAERPGQLGGPGWSVNAGGAMQILVTPYADNMRIHVGFLVIESRSGTNFVRNPG